MAFAAHAPTCALAQPGRQAACLPAARASARAPAPFVGVLAGHAAATRPAQLQRLQLQAVAAAEPATYGAPGPVDEAAKYAVIDIGGHQMLVEEGRWYTCNRLEAEVGSKLQLGRVLALKEAGEFHVGRPYLEDVRIEADVIDEVKAPKVIIFKMRAKKHYRRKTGHRQPLTKFLITKIERA